MYSSHPLMFSEHLMEDSKNLPYCNLHIHVPEDLNNFFLCSFIEYRFNRDFKNKKQTTVLTVHR